MGVAPDYGATEEELSRLTKRAKARIQELIGVGLEHGFDEKGETEMRRLVAEMRADRTAGLKLERKLGSGRAASGSRYLALQAISAGYEVQSMTGVLQLVKSLQTSRDLGFSQFNLHLDPGETPDTAIEYLQKSADFALRALGASWDWREQSTLELLYDSMAVVSMRAHDVDWADSAEVRRRRFVEKFEAQLDANPENGSSPWARLGACAWHSGPHRTSSTLSARVHNMARQALDSFAAHPESRRWNLQSLRSRFSK